MTLFKSFSFASLILFSITACGDDDGSSDVPNDTTERPSDAPCTATTLLADGSFSSRSTFNYAEGRLTSTTLYFSETGSPVGQSEYIYSGAGELLREDFNGRPSEQEFTGRVDYTYDDQDRLERIEVTDLPNTLKSRLSFSYDDQGRVSATTRELLDPQSSVTQIAATYAWIDATTAEVTQVISFMSAPDSTSMELRVFEPFTKYRPLWTTPEDLPGNILVERGIDTSADGTLQDGERIFQRTIESGRITAESTFNQSFEVSSTTTYNYACP